MHLKDNIKNRMIKMGSLVLSALFIQIIPLYSAQAEQNNNVSKNTDVVFVLDASKSMLTSDSGKIREEAIKMFVDMSQQGDRAALAAFSDKIVKESNLISVGNTTEKDNFKKLLSNVPLGDWTDIGMGLKKASDILDKGHDQTKRPMIILLSDGNNDPARAKNLSEEDLKSALNTAKSKGYQIYTIGLNSNGSVDENQLKTIAEETSGKCFIAKTAGELTAILKDIYVDSSKQSVLDEKSINGNGDYQDVPINIPEANILEANVSILSTAKVDIKVFDPNGKEQTSSSGKIVITNSNSYSVVKIINPVKGNWVLKVKGVSGDKIKASLISNYELNLNASLTPEKDIHKGDKVKVVGSFSNSSGKISDEEFYKNIKAKIIVKKISDNSIKEVNMVAKGGSIEGEYTIPDKGKYEVKIAADVNGLSKESNLVEINTVNRVPSAVGKIDKISLAPDSRAKIIYVSQYFSDGDGDSLTYSIKNTESSVAKVSLNGDNLSITPNKKGSMSIVLTAKDENGGSVDQTIDVHVNSKLFQLMHDMYILFILIAVIIISVILLIRTQLKLKSFR